MEKYTYYNLDPYKNQIYSDFYDRLFADLDRHYTFLCFPRECSTVHHKIIYMPWDFAKLLQTKSMQSSSGKIQTAHSYKLNSRMIDSRFEHMCFAYMLGVDLLLILEQNGYVFDAKTKVAFILKLLLHDIGHGPFSHPFEQMVDGYKGMHEDIGNRCIMEDPEISSCLESIYPGLTDYIVNFKEKDKTGLNELVEGIFDLDRAAFLIVDTWLSNFKLYDGKDKTEDLISAVYKIFDNIILRNGHVYYKKECFNEMQFFIGQRAFNYAHLYQEKSRVLDDLLLHEYGVELLKSHPVNESLRPLLDPVESFKNFLYQAKTDKDKIDLPLYFDYVDSDLEKRVFLSLLYDDPTLNYFARLFLSPTHYMTLPFDITRFTDKSSYEQVKQANPNTLHAENKIKIYKSTPEEHVIFYDEATDEYTDFKDMPNRTLDINTIEEYYIYNAKQPVPLPNVSTLISYFINYLKEQSVSVLKDCLYCKDEDHDKLNLIILKKLIEILSFVASGHSFQEYAETHHITLNQVYNILSLYTYDSLWTTYASFLSISSNTLGIYWQEVTFTNHSDQEKFMDKLKSIIESNNTLEDIPNYDSNSLFARLCISTSNIVFINIAVLNSISLTEETRSKITSLLEQSRQLLKEYK